MNNTAILLATIAFLAVSSFLMIGIGIQTAEAGGANCPSKGGAITTIDPNAPNAANTDIPPVSTQPTF
jgi:hypothetical protein